MVAIEAAFGPSYARKLQYKSSENASNGLDRPRKLEHFARKLVGASGDIGVGVEDAGLNLVLQARNHNDIVVHDVVHDRVEDHRGSPA